MFLVSSLFFFCLVPCGRLSWLVLVSFWAHVNIVHHIISYHVLAVQEYEKNISSMTSPSTFTLPVGLPASCSPAVSVGGRLSSVSVRAMQEEDRLRRSFDERCAKVVNDGRCAAHKSPAPASDARAAVESSPCNGSPTLQRQTTAARSVDDANESVYSHHHHHHCHRRRQFI